MLGIALERISAAVPPFFPLDHLSYSSLNEFAVCPLRWRYRYLENRDVPRTRAMVVGSAIHKGIECYYRGQDGVAGAYELLCNDWIWSPDELPKYYAIIQRCVKGYMRDYPADAEKVELTTEIKLTSGVKITSRTDLLNNATVIDYKSSGKYFEPDPFQLFVNALTLTANQHEVSAGEIRRIRKDIIGTTKKAPLIVPYYYEFTQDFVTTNTAIFIRRMKDITARVTTGLWTGPPPEKNVDKRFCVYACSMERCDWRNRR